MKFRTLALLAALLISVMLTLPSVGQSVMVFPKEREEKTLTEDGTKVLLTCFYKNAAIKLDENPSVEKLINSYLENAEITAFAQCRTRIDEQIGFWLGSQERGDEWQSWYAQELRTELTSERTDNSVISFKVQDYEYTGGAHGMYGISGLSFDKQTGRLLSLADLSDSPAVLREKCVDEIYRQCQTQEGLWWYDEASLRPALEMIVDRDSWYLTDEGIVFHSDPYELAPYAAGAIEFIVAYDLLPGLNF